MAEKKTETTKDIKLNPKVWEVELNPDLVAQVLYVYRSNERKGTATTKTRADVRGGGRKPWRQKGTGRARHGSIRSPIWRKGGVVFGPSGKQNWKRKINSKMAKKATCMMLTDRLNSKELEFVNIEKENIKDLRKKALENAGKKTLVISTNEDMKLAVRNIDKINFVDTFKVNAKHIVDSTKVLVDKESVKILEERLTNGK
ncbi:MAG: 50S ribosomal protein L4 [candidate division WS6 bacterium 34_10]|uniref:Large ribosomal subunit protein uL4 n=1 Tax=candidate division WS6 bacterium 34_10 TaxID=1641389 RepID=A0A101HIF1_9BACT|nr:MAG: 50S ribosomal protein L4 [candidate division WS6 bacterium 34_10]